MASGPAVKGLTTVGSCRGRDDSSHSRHLIQLHIFRFPTREMWGGMICCSFPCSTPPYIFCFSASPLSLDLHRDASTSQRVDWLISSRHVIHVKQAFLFPESFRLVCLLAQFSSVHFSYIFNVHVQNKLLQHTPVTSAHTPVINWPV